MAGRISYSNVVAWLKVILPLLALAILATLFLVPKDVDLDSAIPFADVELEQRLRDQQITQPSFSAQTPQGHTVSVTASMAHPDAETPSRTVAENISAKIAMTNGQSITIEAANGEMDADFKEVVLDDGVSVQTTSGLSVDTVTMTVSLDELRAETGGTVTATTDFGRLEAGRMALRPAGDGDDIYLFFTKGVRLLYTPKKTTR